MKLLLTSAGIKNASIQNALVDLLGKPIAECNALCIPTAMYGHPQVGPGAGVWRFISGRSTEPMCELGWKSLGVLELTALPSIDEERWVPLVRETDALLVSGGDALYLCHWLRQSGLADLLPSLRELVWVGLSAGSMVMTPRIGEDFVGWKPPGGGDSTLGMVDFSIFPHVDHELLPENTMAEAERWAAGLQGPAYAIDDETAIKVTDGEVEVVSEGHWRLFAHSPEASLEASPGKHGVTRCRSRSGTSRRIWRTSARGSTARPTWSFAWRARTLELEKSGLSYQHVPPGYRFPYGHTHETQEEVYVVVRGSGRMKLDDEIVELREWDAVRVPPGTWRGYEAGPDGLEILVIGAPSLGEARREDVDGRRDWWADQ